MFKSPSLFAALATKSTDCLVVVGVSSPFDLSLHLPEPGKMVGPVVL